MDGRRNFDAVVFGATGFTGQRVLKELVSQGQGWGRDDANSRLVFQAVCLPQLCMKHRPGVKGVITVQRNHVSQALCSRWEEQRQA